MPVPPGLLIDIAVLIAREVWRSRQRRTLPAGARTSTRPRTPSRRLSPIGRLLRLAAIATILWLVWREVTRRRDALIAARRAASATAAPPMPPAAPPVPTPAPLTAAPASPEAATPPAADGEAGDEAQPAPAEALPSASPAAPASPEAATPPAANGEAGGGVHSVAAASDDSGTEGQERRNGELIGWCARCREHHPMQQVTFTTNASGRRIARGICPVCGAGITRFVTRAQEADDPAA